MEGISYRRQFSSLFPRLVRIIIEINLIELVTMYVSIKI